MAMIRSVVALLLVAGLFACRSNAQTGKVLKRHDG
jgi:hypothetical protein